ncbi:MAG TPA: SRPBCC domain-containing protein [Rhizomicrobium sp.]|nr:SRPBCC domain-containing protein [Rhizomicrobium sp.]
MSQEFTPPPGFDMSPVKPGTTLTLTRTLEAPRELVFKMWTDAKHLKEWWGPAGSENGETRIELRVGGKIFIQMRGPGFDHPMGGEFREIDPPRRLVFTSTAFQNADRSWQFVNLNTITFEDLGGSRTRLTVHVVVQKASDTNIVPVGGMELGWAGSLDRLSDHLAKT